MKYKEFLETKEIKTINSGFEIKRSELNNVLFEFQKDIVLWCLRKGKSAIFADTGLGKTFMQIEWSKYIYSRINKNILIIAPLAVSEQTINEGKKIDVKIKKCFNQLDIEPGINIINYEKMHKFDLSKFGGIVLDESSILKSYSGKYRNELINKTKSIKYRLACTATPAPNDYMELGNHSEFLNVMKRNEMLSSFFVNDCDHTQDWRLKKYAEENFWFWVSSWAAIIKLPSDLGYKDGGFKLPDLNIINKTVETDKPQKGFLFKQNARTLTERRNARRSTLNGRVLEAEKLINKDEKFLIWCNLNIESDLLAKKIDDSVMVQGSDKDEIKQDRLLGFANNKYRILITKPKIAGFGMNWQSCNNIIFVGLSDSFEKYYQAIRRCWRFGQKKIVNVYIITADIEGNVIANIKRKEEDAKKMSDKMKGFTRQFVIENLKSNHHENGRFEPLIKMEIPGWLK